MNLFDYSPSTSPNNPLAYRMRPRTLDEIIGQNDIVGPGSSLRTLICKDELHSFILFGPPGTGKTTIAQIIANMTHSYFEKIQAVTAGVKDIRKVAAHALDTQRYYQQKTILFIDEIHRFNKNQQDVLLPYIEDGTLVLIGATTENPLYELNTALVSRVKIYTLKALGTKDLAHIINKALKDKTRGYGNYSITIDDESVALIAQICKGDARAALNILESIVNTYYKDAVELHITPHMIRTVNNKVLVRYDKKGDYHYDIISAFIKSIRGSDPDAALFWLAVMIEGGEDPKFIARRLIVHAAEDIGLADPYALNIACSAAQAVEFVGLPEARIPLAEATIYLATAPKSNSSKTSIDKAIACVRKSTNINVPSHIADASHYQSKKLGKGIGYKYPHDYNGYVRQDYLPPHLRQVKFYSPTDKGYESKIGSYLKQLKSYSKDSD